jgi:hypothetical protein
MIVTMKIFIDERHRHGGHFTLCFVCGVEQKLEIKNLKQVISNQFLCDWQQRRPFVIQFFYEGDRKLFYFIFTSL